MQATSLGRVGLALAAFGLAIVGLLMATEGNRFPGVRIPTVVLAPAAVVDCSAAGPYEAPAPDSVGLPPGLALCVGGPVTVTTAGVVLDGWDVRGGIVVDAPDVVVRRSRITGDGVTPYGIRTTAAGSVRIEDTTLTGDFPEAAVGGDRWTAERVEITGVTHDGARLGDLARLRNSWLHDFVPAAGTESDGLALRGPGGDVLVEDNRIELGSGPGYRSAVLLAPEPGRGGEGPVVIRGNVLGGGRYTVHEDSAGRFIDVRVTGNRFHRDAEQGPLRVSPRAMLADNTFVDGALIPAR